MRNLICILAAIPLLLTGCADLPPLPTKDQLAVADCGPKPDKYQEVIKAWIGETLKDPDSAIYKNFSDPVRDCIRTSIFDGSKLFYGWSVTVKMNAKNGYGGYGGYELYSFILRDNVIIATCDPPGEFWHVVSKPAQGQ